MALTIRDLTPEEKDAFGKLTGEKTTAKALVKAANIGVSTTAQLAEANARIKELELSLLSYKQALRGLSSHCAHVIELANQDDAFIAS
ncbi:hypothetical protein LZ023_40690 (plasmid) [Pseudomonas silvicola]|nr:hypothetical protein LZ023_40965 [Pseudomonas silvicola]WAH62253.1 hypothetical protein LZ023_40690 [Pseudomonas silvicola]